MALSSHLSGSHYSLSEQSLRLPWVAPFQMTHLRGYWQEAWALHQRVVLFHAPEVSVGLLAPGVSVLRDQSHLPAEAEHRVGAGEEPVRALTLPSPSVCLLVRSCESLLLAPRQRRAEAQHSRQLTDIFHVLTVDLFSSNGLHFSLHAKGTHPSCPEPLKIHSVMVLVGGQDLGPSLPGGKSFSARVRFLFT